jgi:Uma2 family endonuclease
MTLSVTQTPLNTWQRANWDEFVQIADNSQNSKLKGYYYQGHCRLEPMSTGSDHSKDHMTISVLVGLFAALRGIAMNAHDACSYRQLGRNEFQPDISVYVGENANRIPWGTRVVDVDTYPLPDLVIEISDTSLADDLGAKRLQYEDLGIPEYWIVAVEIQQIFGFAISPDGSSRRIRTSQVLPGLGLNLLGQALQRSRTEHQAAVTAWFMEQVKHQLNHP